MAKGDTPIALPENEPMPFILTTQLTGASYRSRLMALAGLLAALSLPAAVAAAPRLRCQLAQGDAVQILDFAPGRDPYGAKAVDVHGNFRFKAVVVGDAQKIDYIKLYAYYQAKRQAVLLHEAKYLTPAVASGAAGPATLTGTNYLYSPDLGRELQYACALLEAAP